jgi:hypothetical protein
MAKRNSSELAERKSYVDFINKTLANENYGEGVLTIPIDANSEKELFEVASQGVLLV